MLGLVVRRGGRLGRCHMFLIRWGNCVYRYFDFVYVIDWGFAHIWLKHTIAQAEHGGRLLKNLFENLRHCRFIVTNRLVRMQSLIKPYI